MTDETASMSKSKSQRGQGTGMSSPPRPSIFFGRVCVQDRGSKATYRGTVAFAHSHGWGGFLEIMSRYLMLQDGVALQDTAFDPGHAHLRNLWIIPFWFDVETRPLQVGTIQRFFARLRAVQEKIVG